MKKKRGKIESVWYFKQKQFSLSNYREMLYIASRTQVISAKISAKLTHCSRSENRKLQFRNFFFKAIPLCFQIKYSTSLAKCNANKPKIVSTCSGHSLRCLLQTFRFVRWKSDLRVCLYILMNDFTEIFHSISSLENLQPKLCGDLDFKVHASLNI